MPRFEDSHVVVSPDLLAQLHSVGDDPAMAEEIALVVTRFNRLKELVHEAVESLDEPYRTVIEGLFWEGATLDELASRIGVGHRSTVMRHRDKALKMLKRKLEVTECPMLWMQHCSEVRPSSSRTRSRT